MERGGERGKGRERKERRELGNNMIDKRKIMRLVSHWRQEKNVSRKEWLIMSDATGMLR